MELAFCAFDFREGVNFIKVRYQRNPNDEWMRGFGVCVFNVTLILYWGKKE